MDMTDHEKIEKLVEALKEATHLYEKALSNNYGNQNYGDSIDNIEAEFDRLDKWVAIYCKCDNEPTGFDKLMEILKDRHDLRT